MASLRRYWSRAAIFAGGHDIHLTAFTAAQEARIPHSLRHHLISMQFHQEMVPVSTYRIYGTYVQCNSDSTVGKGVVDVARI